MRAVRYGNEGVMVFGSLPPTNFCNLRSAFFFELDFRAKEGKGI